jgi:hypothetical protein
MAADRVWADRRSQQHALLRSLNSEENFAQRPVEMHAAKDNGLDSAEPRTPKNTTPTSFRQWCEEGLKPAFLNS